VTTTWIECSYDGRPRAFEAASLEDALRNVLREVRKIPAVRHPSGPRRWDVMLRAPGTKDRTHTNYSLVWTEGASGESFTVHVSGDVEPFTFEMPEGK
jgi:hypothetical protein